MAFVEALLAILGAAMVLVVPGLTWSLLLFPEARWWRRWHDMERGAWATHASAPADPPDLVARLLLALALSIAMAPIIVIVVFWLPGIPFTPWTGWAAWVAVSAIPLAWPRVRARLGQWQRPAWSRLLESRRDPPARVREPPLWRRMAQDVARQRVFLGLFAVTTLLLVVEAARIALDPTHHVEGAGRSGWSEGWSRGIAILWLPQAAILLGARGGPEAGAPAPQSGLLHRHRWLVPALLLSMLVVAWVLHRWPYRTTTIPLGYDYGYYKATFDFFAGAAPAVPLTSQPAWMELQFPPGLPLLHQALSVLGGISSYTHLWLLFPLLSTVLVVGFFVVARMVFGTVPALLSAALFALSRTQLLAYELLYEKNVVGILLFLAILVLVQRRHWVAAGIVTAAVATYHRPMLLLTLATLAITAIVSIVRHRQWRGWTQIALVGAAIAAPVALLLPETFLGVAQAAAREIAASIGGEATGRGGTFFDRGQVEVVSYAYLPLGLAGVFLALGNGAWILRVTMLLCLATTYLELVFHRRFLLMLDMAVILLAGASLWMLRPRRWPRVAAAAVPAVILVLALAPSVHDVADQPRFPFEVTTPDQYEGILWLREGLPDDAVILTNNIAAPLVYAESGHTTYGPLLFGDPHTQPEWNRFLGEPDDVEYRTAFLEAYGGPLYLVVFLDHPPRVQWTGTFGPPHFEVVHDTPAMVVVRFLPD